MKQNERTIQTIVGLSIFALIGLVTLQIVLLRNAYEFQQQAFERNVHSAMNAIAQKLETREAAGNIFHVALTVPQTTNKIMTLRIESDSAERSMKPESPDVAGKGEPFGGIPLHIDKNIIRYTVPSAQHVTLRVMDLGGHKDTLLVDGVKERGEYLVAFDAARISSGECIVKFRAGENTYTMHSVNGDFRGIVRDSTLLENREKIVGRVMENLSQFEREPIEQRLHPALLDSVVSRTLIDEGITLPFVYGVLTERDDSLRLVKPAGYEKELLASGYRNMLFPNDLLFSKNNLLLYFPDQNIFLLKRVGLFLGLTVIFMGIIIACFAYTVLALIKQKKFAVGLGDFINNMTHEFKTPITTIAVATETIVRPEIIGQPEKVLRYGNVIQDETSRMRKQVDKILQIAVLEEGDYELKRADVDLHDLIQRAVNNITLQVEEKNGTIACRLDASHAIVRGDSLHLANIIHNILDNACKYSPEKPSIIVTTSNIGSDLAIDVTDHGIGISRENVARVFEKYYRAHTGNLHDVKGFGLGLAYTKLIVEAHSGKVSLESEPGKGTTVHLLLPVVPDGRA